MNFESPPAPLSSAEPAIASARSKSKTKLLWLPFSASPGSYEASYAVEGLTFNGRDVGTLSLLFRVANLSSCSLSLDLSISSHSSGSYRLSSPNGKVSLTSGTSLAAKTEAQQAVQIDLAPTINPLSPNTIECLLALTTDTNSLIATETKQTLSAKILLTTPSFFQAHAISTNELHTLCSATNTSSPPFAGQVSLAIPKSSSNQQKQLGKISKVLLGYLNAHLVEQSEDFSVTCCSSLRLNGSGGAGSNLIVALIKFLPGGGSSSRKSSSEGGVAMIQIKCFGPEQRTAQQVGNETLRALSSLTL
jgi:hypothetical protein